MQYFFIAPDTILYLLDMIGVVACAAAATLLAQHKGFDIFGCILVSMVNGFGGGTVRDLLLDRHPMFWMTDLNYVIVITITSLILQMFFHIYHKIDKAVKLFDAIGLATFSVIGFKVALAQGALPLIAVLMGVCTAIVGGMTRDIICNEIPLVLQKEIYITASILGACVYLILDWVGVHTGFNDFIMLSIIFIIRMFAVTFDWHLPSIRLIK
ncbi:MAG: hypothetical protein CSA42_02955 [Gammaproteobacteria bacterium]|nr:MAG: hypothetical protein CSA42_02955 [Gammaproteobacteria bacterium]